MKRTILGLVTALGVAGCGADRGESPPVRSALALAEGAAACMPRPGESRWIPSIGAYTATQEYGRADEPEWFGGVAGVARAEDGRLFVLDLITNHVVVLSPSLTRVGEFGRKGKGPGEFSFSFPLSVPPGLDWIEVVDSLVYVYDLYRLGRFTLDGEFVDYLRQVPTGFQVVWTAKKFLAGPEHLLFPYDVLPLNMLGQEQHAAAARSWSRSFQILEISEDTARLVFELSLTPPPRGPNGLIQFPLGQASPLWGVYRGCAFLSDGEADRVLRHDLASGVTDTLALPHHEVPGPDPEDVERVERAKEASLRAAGVSGSGATEEYVPTALKRWDRLLVDPDGHLWIRPWRPSSEDGPFPIDIVNVATGEAKTVTVPAFPDVFGDPGTFYAVERDPETDVDVITRYDLHPSGRDR